MIVRFTKKKYKSVQHVLGFSSATHSCLVAVSLGWTIRFCFVLCTMCANSASDWPQNVSRQGQMLKRFDGPSVGKSATCHVMIGPRLAMPGWILKIPSQKTPTASPGVPNVGSHAVANVVRLESDSTRINQREFQTQLSGISHPGCVRVRIPGMDQYHQYQSEPTCKIASFS